MSDFDTQNMTNIHEQIVADPTTWRLYGTVGCHLCEIAESLLLQAQAVADIRWQSIDIAELPEQEMLKFADKIPVLVTANKTLYYPFSIMDIMALSWKANIDYWHNIKNLIHYVLENFFIINAMPLAARFSWAVACSQVKMRSKPLISRDSKHCFFPTCFIVKEMVR